MLNNGEFRNDYLNNASCLNVDGLNFGANVEKGNRAIFMIKQCNPFSDET